MTDILAYFVFSPPILAAVWWAIVKMWRNGEDPSRAAPWVGDSGKSGYNVYLTPGAVAVTFLILGAGIDSQASSGGFAYLVSGILFGVSAFFFMVALFVYLTGRPKFFIPPSERSYKGAIKMAIVRWQARRSEFSKGKNSDSYGGRGKRRRAS